MGNIWVPRSIGVDGDIVRIFDPHFHVEAPFDWEYQHGMPHPVDKRWVLIERPTVSVGGELTMDQLEVSTNPHTGISEAPLQLKANGGTLVIDDFGRQRMRIDDLLNRWIVPLEAGYDFYSLSSGRRIQMPFQQVIVFSTNLEPRDLVDEAFLRRIPYKIPVGDPTEAQFRQLFDMVSAELGVPVRAGGHRPSDPAPLPRHPSVAEVLPPPGSAAAGAQRGPLPRDRPGPDRRIRSIAPWTPTSP